MWLLAVTAIALVGLRLFEGSSCRAEWRFADRNG